MEFGILGSADDPFRLHRHTGGYLTERYHVDGRVQYSPALISGERAAVILAFGDSTIGNHENANYSVSHINNVQNLSISNGGIYRATDPLLGSDTTNAGGNWLSRLGDKLITAGNHDRVILIPLGLGGGTIGDWAASGRLNYRIGVAARRIASVGLTPTYVLLQCGANDYDPLQTSQGAYTASQSSVIASIRGAGVSCPIFVSRSTWHNGIVNPGISDGIRAAQATAVDNLAGIFAGPDTDTLNNSYRYDATHWNATGADAVAELWQEVIASYLAG